MKLSDLGFDDWFEERAADVLRPEHRIARVTAIDRDACLVRNEDAEVSAELAGRFRFSAQSNVDLPCVGDWVCVQHDTSGATTLVHAVLPRKTFLRRKAPGKAVDFQMIAANIDTSFLVQSCHYDFNVRRLDRYLVMANEGHMESVVVLTKTDLVTTDDRQQIISQIRNAGISAPIVCVSNATGEGLDDFRRLLVPGRTYCLLGSSGVGKSTLINRLIGSDALDTKAVSATGEGVHTTSRRELILLAQGAMLIDTPGMRELGLLGATDGIDASFRDIHEFSQGCRFSDCSHTQEPGCAVIAAVQAGDMSEKRYRSYLKLRKESEYHEMSYYDKRKKDKAFGRFVKSVMKHRKKP